VSEGNRVSNVTLLHLDARIDQGQSGQTSIDRNVADRFCRDVVLPAADDLRKG
jgi:hypothetical protein